MIAGPALVLRLVTAAAVAVTVTASAGTAAASGRGGAPVEIRPGDRGEQVAGLQRVLRRHRYYFGPVNGLYTEDLIPAVWAFQHVNGIEPAATIREDTLRALDRPRRPPRITGHRGKRVEVDLSRRLLVIHQRGVVLVSHISTGSGRRYCVDGECERARTPPGDFRVHRRVNGWHRSSLGSMYRPLYFHAGYAIHGSFEVPRRPDSHGCVRVPMALSDRIFRIVRNGWPVYIRR
ncbi:L,D-transpeptidase family protein [Nonomuraea sp. NPDC050310]|uniref:L,D-transpeptidase family protein n=1 Tax=Nonomuraea sp. NPDC050310 TaxID=3154935 RepID=UPI0033F77D63